MGAEVAELLAWGNGRLGEPFRWGVNDCAMLCLEAADRIAGTQLAVRHRGRYANAAEALRYLRRNGLALTRELVGAGFGQPGGTVLLPGDILVHPGPHGLQHGYVGLGELSLTAREDDGVCAVRTRAVLLQRGCRAWRRL